MNKKVRKIFMVVSIIGILILLDFAQVKLLNSEPLFYIEKDIPYGKVHLSFLTDVYYCNNGNSEDVYIESKDSKFSCPLAYKSKEDFVILDTSDIDNCNGKIDYVYEDKYYKYYVKCKKSSNVFIKLKNDVKLPVKEALDRQLVTVSELERKGLEFYKERK